MLLALVLGGCRPAAVATDAGTPDAAMADAGVDAGAQDGGSALDAAGAADAAAHDAALVDAAVDAGTDAGPANDDDGGTAPVDAGRAALPPWLTYCDLAPCAATPAVVVRVCPASDPGCTPARSTTLIPAVDGIPVSAVFFPVFMPEGASLSVVSGNASIIAHLLTAYAPAISLHSDLDVRFSYYDLAPAWGGTVTVNFETTRQAGAVVDSVFYRQTGFDAGTASAELHARAQVAVADERTITGVSSERIHAFFLPTELAGVSGEGNWSLGDGTVTINYGNPAYIADLGGIMNVAFPRFAHEAAHELFNEVSVSFTGNPVCLNEGIADALAFVAGHLPVQDFGPMGLQGVDFDQGCAAASEVHDVGNCYFWKVKTAGLLTPAFMHGIFHPQHVYAFDSCAQNTETTGNSILVMFTEAAAGADLVTVLDAMGIPHAATYDAAKVALGW